MPSIQPVAEAGGSIFNSLSALRTLIAATSEDDVHAQAVLTVEKLGACIPTTPDRIGEAVDALGGQTSVKVQNLQALVGISSGGLSKMMRQSTPLLQFFVFCSACKMIFVDEECSTLVFEMLKSSSVLANLPCSAAQIARMITQFSGQADTIAPVYVMHEVASAIDHYHPEPDIFRRLEFKTLAELLTTLFDSLRDQAVESIVLTGHANCVWLASTLIWLLGDEACIAIRDNIVKGDPKAKLCVKIEPTNNVPWNLQIFKESQKPTEFVFAMPPDEPDSLHRIPLQSLKVFMSQYYWSAFETAQIRQRAASASGIIAQTLIIAASQRGLLSLECEFCQPPHRCNSTELSAVAHTSWLANIERAMIKYGWSEDVKFDPVLLSKILAAVDLWRESLKRPARAQTLDNNHGELEKAIKEPCQDFIDEFFPDESIETDYILDPALFIAADATVTCTAAYEDGVRYIRPVDDQTLSFADTAILQIFSGGLDISEFRKKAFMQLLPGIETWHHGNLIVARDGYVAGMNLLWNESMSQSDSLSIRVQRGQIKKDQVSYNSICETPFNSMVGLGPRDPAFHPVKGLILPEVGWQHKIKERAYSFETSASIQGGRIELKHYMTYTDSMSRMSQRRKASWISAMNILATASHMDTDSQMTAELTKSLNKRMTQRLIGSDVAWTDPFSAPKIDAGCRTLIRTGWDPKVRIFGAGACYDFRSVCCRVAIRHHTPLLHCIERAESMMKAPTDSWIIVD